LNPTERITPGMKGTETTVVTREITVAHYRPGMPEVYGTPFMIYLMESAAANAIQEVLPEGWVSVGYEVNVRPLAATPIGCTVTATAKVLSRDDRLVTFAVEAHDGTEVIGRGTHIRAAIDPSRFAKRLEAKALTLARRGTQGFPSPLVGEGGSRSEPGEGEPPRSARAYRLGS
jgi:fluoroacetyl-CoA thioesterase